MNYDHTTELLNGSYTFTPGSYDFEIEFTVDHLGNSSETKLSINGNEEATSSASNAVNYSASSKTGATMKISTGCYSADDVNDLTASEEHPEITFSDIELFVE